jgi:hypothetical protein
VEREVEAGDRTGQARLVGGLNLSWLRLLGSVAREGRVIQRGGDKRKGVFFALDLTPAKSQS